MYVDLAGLARYRQDFDAWARGRLLPKDAAAARVRTAKAGAVSFVPVQETPLDVSVDFLFSETGPAEGTKAPDNPSTITGVSSLNAGRVGKNLLLKVASAPSWNGLSITANADGSYTIDGSFNGANEKYFALTDCGSLTSSAKSSVRLDTSKTYTASAELVSGTMSTGAAGVSFAYANTSAGGLTVELSSAIGKDYASKSVAAYEGGQFIFRLNVHPGAVFTNAVLRFQLEEGTEATEFEPPMLPADANHVIELGSTYYGGTVDLATGVMTVTQGQYAFNGTEQITSWTAFENVGRAAFPLNSITALLGGVQACTHLPYTYSWTGDYTHFYVNINEGQNGAIIFAPYFTKEDMKAWMASEYANGTPVTIVWTLRQPFTVQLTPTEILSLTQTDKYTPRLNTVYTDARAVQVGYLKHPSAASADLRNAVVSLGGGV